MEYFKRICNDDKGVIEKIEFYPLDNGEVLVSVANGGRVCRYTLNDNDLKWLKVALNGA